jgi:RNA polymerase sigma-70 factor (ECF subfamily)
MSAASQLIPTRASQVDSSPLTAIVRSHGRALFSRALKLTHRHADASDLVQEVLLRALDHGIDRVPPEKLCNWLFVVMGHINIDRHRRASRCALVALDEARLLSLPAAQSPEEPLWRRLGYEDVRQCLGALDPRVREAYVLHEQEGLSLADTARRLSVPLATAGTRVFRARRKLRAMLLHCNAPAADAGVR